MKTALENQREAQEDATRRRDAYKKKMRRVAFIVASVAGLVYFLVALYFEWA